MFRCSPVAGLSFAAYSFLFVSACTDPVFEPDAGEIDAAGPPNRRTEPGEDGGGQKPPPLCEASSCYDDAGGSPPSELLPDSGTDAGREPDAGSEPDAGLDPVRAKWAGRYAARSALFTFDDPLMSTAKLLSVVSIVPTDTGGLRLEEEMCLYEGGWSFLFTGVLRYTFSNTRGSVPLTYSEEDFNSELMTLQIGYGPAPSNCRPGMTADASDEQVWLTSTCDCPRNDEPPTSKRDCRVTDQEGDKEAGATFRASINASEIVYRTTQEERVRLTKGYRREDRLFADRLFEDTTRILDCTIDNKLTAAASCPNGVPKNCPSKFNQVEMVGIKKSEGCAQVIAQEAALFDAPLPSYPLACPAEVSGTN
jgi:hypothetical protein